MQIKWLKTVLKNLDEEAEYIAKDNPAAAKLVVERIVHTISLLSENPALGHVGRVDGTRELVVPGTRYIVPYRVKLGVKQIEILRIFHTYPLSKEAYS